MLTLYTLFGNATIEHLFFLGWGGCWGRKIEESKGKDILTICCIEILVYPLTQSSSWRVVYQKFCWYRQTTIIT